MNTFEKKILTTLKEQDGKIVRRDSDQMEWTELIYQAMLIGITADEVRSFIQNQKEMRTMDEFITVRTCKKCGTLYQTDVREEDNNICNECLQEEKWVEEELLKADQE